MTLSRLNRLGLDMFVLHMHLLPCHVCCTFCTYCSMYSRYFPGHGDDTYVFLADVPLPSQLPRLKRLTSNLSMQQDILFGVEAWTDDFEHYYEKHFRQTDGESLTLSVLIGEPKSGEGREWGLSATVST